MRNAYLITIITVLFVAAVIYFGRVEKKQVTLAPIRAGIVDLMRGDDVSVDNVCSDIVVVDSYDDLDLIDVDLDCEALDDPRVAIKILEFIDSLDLTYT